MADAPGHIGVAEGGVGEEEGIEDAIGGFVGDLVVDPLFEGLREVRGSAAGEVLKAFLDMRGEGVGLLAGLRFHHHGYGVKPNL